MGNHSDTWQQLLTGIGPRFEERTRELLQAGIEKKLLASVGSVPAKPTAFDIRDRFDRECAKFPTVTRTGVEPLNEFMSALGRDLWRRQYAMEREAFEPWIDFGGES